MRQYIGARYVPKFMGTYDATQAYEALSVVDNGMGTDYISKIPTPAGTPLTNTTYWATYGAYSGAILNLQDQINDMNDGTVPGSLQSQINNIENVDLPAIDTQIQALSSAIGIINGNFIFIGDSYNNPQYSDWGNYAATELGLTSSDYASIYVDGGSISGGQFDTLISTYAAGLTQAEKEAITHIVCCGGINDTVVSANDLHTRMASFISLCKRLFVNANVYMGFIGNSVESSYILHNRDYAGIDKALGVYRRCADIGGKFLEGLEYVLHDYSLMAADGIHPTQAGGAEIGKYIKIALTNGKAHVMRNYRSTTAGSFLDGSTASAVNPITVSDLARADSEYLVNVNQDNGVQTFTFFGRIIMTCATFIACNASTHIQLGTSLLPLVNGKKALVIPITCNARDYNDHTLFHNVKGHIVIDGGAVYLYFDSCDNDWNGNVAIDQFVLNPFSITADTLLF